MCIKNDTTNLSATVLMGSILGFNPFSENDTLANS